MSNPVIDAVNALTLTERTGGYEKAFLLLTDSLELALKGDTLRGLPNLGTHAMPVWGLNLRGPQLNFKVPFPSFTEGDEPALGSLQLVLHESGVPFWMWAYREVRRGWFEFARERVIAGDEGLRPRNDKSMTCHVSERANVITAMDLQRLMTCLPSTIETHLEIIREEPALASDADVLAKRIVDKLRGDK